jgi:mevalonate kinase
MLECGDVKVASAEKIHGEIKRQRERREPVEELPIEASAPGKVVLFGEHAVVYGHPGITASIDAGVRVRISHDPDGPRFVMPQFQQLCPVEDSDPDFQRFARAVDVALTEFNMGHEPVAIAVESDMAPGMGLGSSASFSVALCRALMKYRGAEASDNELLNSAQRLEAIFHGTPSGVDAATVISGGVLWFRKGPPRELVRQVRHSYEMNEQRVTTLLDGIGEITAAAATALGSADFALVGELMDRNHELLMRLGVSTPGLDRAVERLREQGVLGAKLTGAGGGGAVVALVAPEQRHVVISQLEGELPLVLPFDLGATT